jgi:hypothetical protein
VALDHRGEVLEGLQALPAQLRFPIVEEPARPGLRFVIPQLGERLAKQIGIRLGQGIAGELASRTAVGLEQERLRDRKLWRRKFLVMSG